MCAASGDVPADVFLSFHGCLVTFCRSRLVIEGGSGNQPFIIIIYIYMMYRFPHQNFIFSRDFPASHVYQRVNMFPSGQKLDPWAAAITSWRVVAPAMLLIDNPHQYRYIYHKPEIGVIKHLREFVAANWCCKPRVSKSRVFAVELAVSFCKELEAKETEAAKKMKVLLVKLQGFIVALRV